MAGKLDARSKLLAALTGMVAISSTAPGSWLAFGLFAAAVAVLIACSGARLRSIWFRWRLGAPFLLLAGGLLMLSGEWERGASVVIKGGLALALLTLLVESVATAALIRAIRQLGVPPAVSLVASLMVRYIAMLSEEFQCMSRARLARAGAPLAGVALFSVHGNQIGWLLIRSWERAERIHQAMLARGFQGSIPDLHPPRFGRADAALVLGAVLLFGGIWFGCRG